MGAEQMDRESVLASPQQLSSLLSHFLLDMQHKARDELVMGLGFICLFLTYFTH